MQIAELFEKHNNQFLKSEARRCDDQFTIISNMRRVCRDNALIDSSHHDMITFGVDIYDFMEEFTESEIVEMIRCGLIYNDEWECLGLYV